MDRWIDGGIDQELTEGGFVDNGVDTHLGGTRKYSGSFFSLLGNGVL